MKLTVGFILLLLFTACRVPEHFVTGTYKSNFGDSLKIFEDHTFRAEIREPDTAILKQVRFSGGRWELEKGKLYLATATRDMGPYWGCVPLSVGFNHLSRPIECTENKSGYLNFNKILLQPKQKTRRAKKDKELVAR
jgi:hypothetical protein